VAAILGGGQVRMAISSNKAGKARRWLGFSDMVDLS
jgi:hypothetical protein